MYNFRKNKYTIYLQTTKVKSKTHSKQPMTRKAQLELDKFHTYFNYRCDIDRLKPHEILAINRGEKLKIINVSIIVTDSIMVEMKSFMKETCFSNGLIYEDRTKIIERSFKDCYTKKCKFNFLHSIYLRSLCKFTKFITFNLININTQLYINKIMFYNITVKPFLCRHIRSELNELARKASINVFARNLKHLLLTLPQKGERIMGIDPGFKNGCKYAIISETANVITSGVLYPHLQNTDPEDCGEKLAKTLIKHR